MSKEDHTFGPWSVYRMVHDENGDPFTPEEVGEYVVNSIRLSEKLSGHTDFLYIGAAGPGGDVDICHIGNGPNGPNNAELIASAPEMYEELVKLRARVAELEGSRREVWEAGAIAGYTEAAGEAQAVNPYPTPEPAGGK